MSLMFCSICGAFADDGLGEGYMARHRESPMHLAMIGDGQQGVIEARKRGVRQRWVDGNGPWLVEEAHVPIEERELRMERVGEVELLIQKGRVFHVPLPERTNAALCGLVLRNYDLVDRFKLPVGEAVFRVCEVCDSDGKLQAEELERVEMEIKTCPYCLGVFGSVGARKAHEEDCGL